MLEAQSPLLLAGKRYLSGGRCRELSLFKKVSYTEQNRASKVIVQRYKRFVYDLPLLFVYINNRSCRGIGASRDLVKADRSLTC